MTKEQRDALRFYANPHNWVRSGNGQHGSPTNTSPAQRDGGDIARKALSAVNMAQPSTVGGK